MKYKIKDYDLKEHISLDDWIDESKYINAKKINMYAAYNEPMSDTYHYFLNNPFDMANIKTFIKVFESENIYYGVAVFHYYKEEDKFYLAINPIIINPEFINQGIGTIIIKQIVEEAIEFTKGHIDIIKGDAEESNKASIKILEKNGFKIKDINENFIEYIYELKQ